LWGRKACGPPKPWPLHEIEELAVLQKLFKLAYAVPAELFVLEIDGVPGAVLAAEDIDRPRFRVSGYEQEQQNLRRQFNPANDCDVLGNLS
jgi:hypothetical protein